MSTDTDATNAEPATYHDRWAAKHEGHDLAERQIGEHRATLCRTCDDLHCWSCFAGEAQ